LALPTGVFSLWGLDFGKGVLENVMRIQVPRGLIPHHLRRPAGVSPPGFFPQRGPPRLDHRGANSPGSGRSLSTAKRAPWSSNWADDLHPKAQVRAQGDLIGRSDK
jgi:hypothetical protein